jgi:uncharacterized membrane protein YfcA
MRLALLAALVIIFCGYLTFWVIAERRRKQAPGSELSAAGTARLTSPERIAVGFVTNFFDTLGIGDFATAASIFKLRRLVADENIPGTLNVGHALPTFAEALIFISLVRVDARTLALMIIAAVVGAWVGAGVVSRWPRKAIQIGLGLALLAAAVLMGMAQANVFPAGGMALGLSGARLWVAVGMNCVLGALMTLGIGLYAPCMILVSMLGMDPRVAFPIMMGSCAFLMPAASIRFIRSARYDRPAAIGLTLGGTPAVLIAAYLVRSLPLGAVRLLVIVVVLYTAISMLLSAAKSRRKTIGDQAAPAAVQ